MSGKQLIGIRISTSFRFLNCANRKLFKRRLSPFSPTPEHLSSKLNKKAYSDHSPSTLPRSSCCFSGCSCELTVTCSLSRARIQQCPRPTLPHANSAWHLTVTSKVSDSTTRVLQGKTATGSSVSVQLARCVCVVHLQSKQLVQSC